VTNVVDSRPGVRHNLPTSRDTFVGRTEELAVLRSLLRSRRLVTLTGAAGVGKTRLAVEVAHANLDEYDESWLVELAALVDGALVPQALTSLLRLSEEPGHELVETLARHLADRRALIVLDNAEHVVTACAHLADTLLAACPGVSVLATSQEPLRIAGEAQWPVPALDVPSADAVDTDALAGYPSVRLFCDRAGERRGFVLTPEVAPAVSQICRRLDGIPLAIELAAARVGVLSPHEIAGRLDDRFRLLTGGSRAVLPRHQTLRRALDWSYDLLSEAERALLRRLSVFAGGATLHDTERVCAGDEVAEADVFELLAALVAKSLVLATSAGTQTRFVMLETVRHYGRDRLIEAGEAGEWRARQALWCLAVAERAEPELTGRHQRLWLERLQAEHDNLQAALAWATAEGDGELTARLSSALTLFWRMRGHFAEGRRWLDAALQWSPSLDHRLKARLRWGAGFLALMVGDPGATSHLEESLELYRGLDDRQGIGRALLLLGNCLVFSKPEMAVDVLHESMTEARKAQDSWCLAHALAECGLALVRQGEVAEARRALEESVAVSSQAGDDQGLRIALSVLGDLCLQCGDLDEADLILTRALRLVRELDESYGISAVLANLAELATTRGEYQRSIAFLHEALAIARDTGSPSLVATALHGMGIAEHAQGHLDDARRLFEEILTIVPEGREYPSVQIGLGEVLASSGDTDRAHDLFQHGLAAAELDGDRWKVGRALHDLGELARTRSDERQASDFHHRALRLRVELGDVRGVTESLEALGGLAEMSSTERRSERAVRMLASAQAVRQAKGYVRPPWRDPSHQAHVARLRKAVGDERFEAAWAEGAALSWSDAAAHAMKGRGPRDRPTSGWESLTTTEREIASLVGQAMNNAQISERLFISRSTVKGHLGRMFAKLGISSRGELAQEVARRLAPDTHHTS